MILSRDVYDVVISEGLSQEHIEYQGDGNKPFFLILSVLNRYYNDYPEQGRVERIDTDFLDYVEQYRDVAGWTVGNTRDLKAFVLKYCVKKSGRIEAPLPVQRAREYAVQYVALAGLQDITLQIEAGIQDTDRLADILDRFQSIQDQILTARSEVSEADDILTSVGEEDFLNRSAIRSSGLDWLNNFMEGGVTDKECYGFIGPSGSCKTTFINMLACEAALQAQYDALQENRPPKIVYYFSWEETKEEAAARMYSYLGEIHRNSFMARTSREITIQEGLLSSRARGNYKDYERARHIELGEANPSGELDRLRMVQEDIGATLRFIDFTDPQGRWSAYRHNSVEGIESVIRQSQRALGNPGVACVLVDYVNRAARAYMEHRGISMDQLRHHAGSFPGKLKDRVLVKYNCHGWVVQQASTDAAGKSAGVIPNQTGAAEARNFTENLAFAFAVGTKSPSGHCVFVATKQRRAGTSLPIVVKIHDRYNRIDPDRNMRIAGGKLINATEVGIGIPEVPRAPMMEAEEFENLADPPRYEDSVRDVLRQRRRNIQSNNIADVSDL